MNIGVHEMAVHIDRVRIVPLKKVVNERGHLMEVQRRDDDHYPGFGQAYITATRPGVVKAWYRHATQTDQIAPVKGALILALYDARETSPTYRSVQEIHLTEAEPVLVQIPPGVWHGFMPHGAEPALLLHLNTIPWDSAHPDEDRLPPHDPGIPYRWAV